MILCNFPSPGKNTIFFPDFQQISYFIYELCLIIYFPRIYDPKLEYLNGWNVCLRNLSDRAYEKTEKLRFVHVNVF